VSTVRLIVEGRVQGVGFRWFTRSVAEAFDITGSVQNREDGAVEIVASGSSDNIASFREQIELGPDGARVDGVRVEPLPEQRFPGFTVLR